MIAALYKTWRGEEFVKQSLASIYDSVEKIIMLHSDVSWLGQKGNTVKSVVAEWKRAGNDPKNKVIEIDFNSQGQDEQYWFGMQWIHSNFPDHKWVLIIDTDEVWDADQLAALIAAARENSLDYFKCAMFTYIKSPLYRIYPTEPCRPVVLAKNNGTFPTGPRGRDAKALVLDGVRFHHYTMVRKDIQNIKDKMRTASIGDNMPSLDPDGWAGKFWDQIPAVSNFHFTQGWESAWKTIETIPFESVPSAMKKAAWRFFMEQISPDDLQESLTPSPWNWTPAMIEAAVPYLEQSLASQYQSFLLAQRLPSGANILEIGCGRGGNIIVMHQANPSARFTAIDPFSPYDETSNTGTLKGYQGFPVGEFLSNMGKFGIEVNLIQKTSDAAVADIPDGSQDLIYLDGNHSPGYVEREIIAYRPKLRPGGTLCGHDYHPRFPGVIADVKKALGQGFTVLPYSSVWVAEP